MRPHHQCACAFRLDRDTAVNHLFMMAVYSPNRFSDLKKCVHSRRLIAERLKVPRNFIIDQERVRIDTFSKFSHGAFAKVIRAEYHGAEVRVKRVHAILTEFNRLDLHRFFQECRLASDLRHPNIVHFYGVVMDGSLPMLVMEELVCNLNEFIGHPERYISSRFNVSRDPLSNIRSNEAPSSTCDSNEQNSSAKPPQQRITERVKINIALGIAQGLDYLHTKKPYPIVHRDLSSSNILLGTFSFKTVAKIADFGQSKEIKSPEHDWSSHNPGTISYLPPEILRLDTNGQQQYQQQQQQPVEAGARPLNIQAEVHDQAQADLGDVDENAASDNDQDVEQVPEAREPDEVQNLQELSRSVRSQPKLQTSIDMYMYGVLVSELGTQQPEHLEMKDNEDSWHAHHVKKLERIDKDSILYRIAKGCVLEDPSKRFKAAEVIAEITRQFASTDIQLSTGNEVGHCRP